MHIDFSCVFFIYRMCQFPRVVQLYGASLKHKVVLMERIGRGNLRQVGFYLY